MTDGFIRKKVPSLTLGEKLIKLRSQYRMSLVEISKATKIQVKYLEALESGDHRGLPAEVYVRGFLRSYARYLGLEDDAFLKLYDKEKHIQTNLKSGDAQPKPKKFEFHKATVITPRTLLIGATVCILIGTLWYLFRELNAFVAEPYLVVTTPTPGMTVTGSEVSVEGVADRGAQLSLNGEPVLVGNDGGFRETVSLQRGTNTLRLVATNRFDRSKEVTVSVESIAGAGAEATELPVEVSVSKPGVTLSLEADGVLVWNGAWPTEKRETISVRETLRIVSNDPMHTLLGVAGKSDRPVTQSAQETGPVTFSRTLLESYARTGESHE